MRGRWGRGARPGVPGLSLLLGTGVDGSGKRGRLTLGLRHWLWGVGEPVTVIGGWCTWHVRVGSSAYWALTGSNCSR